MSAVVNVTARARRETCNSVAGDTRGCSVDPLEMDLEVLSQSDDFAADSSGVSDCDGVMSDPNTHIDDPTAMHGEPARHTPAVVGGDAGQHGHSCYRVHTQHEQA